MNQRRLQFIHRPCRLAERRDKISLPLHGAWPWPVWVWEASVSFVRDPTAARNCRAAERVSDHESVAVRPSVRARARSAPTPRTAQRILGTRRATPSQATPRLWTDAWLFAHTSPPPPPPSVRPGKPTRLTPPQRHHRRRTQRGGPGPRGETRHGRYCYPATQWPVDTSVPPLGFRPVSLSRKTPNRPPCPAVPASRGERRAGTQRLPHATWRRTAAY